MTCSRASAKKAGASFESFIAGYFAAYVGDRVERRTKNGSKDRGDISGLRHMGEWLVVETKDYGGQLNVGPWPNVTKIERLNDDASVGLVVAKRRGKARPEDQLVLLTLADFVSLLPGAGPPEVS